MGHFTLNDRCSNLYYSVLTMFAVSVLYILITFSIYKETPTREQIQKWLIFMVSVVVYHMIIDPSIKVNVLDDSFNNSHVSKI